MISQPRRISSRDWAIGLPCSSVMAIAISSTRPRISSTAFRITSARFAGAVRDHSLKPCSAASSAASRSARVACGTVASTDSSAGLNTGWPSARFHAPPMNSCKSG